MVYWHNKIKDEVSLHDFMKVVDFLAEEGIISTNFFGHHDIYSFYKDLAAYKSEKEAMIDTCQKFNIGRVTFYNIKKKFKHS